MAAIDFPNSPSNGATYVVSGRKWTYDGTAWNLTSITSTVFDGSVTNSSLASNAVTTVKILNEAVTWDKLSSDASIPSIMGVY